MRRSALPNGYEKNKEAIYYTSRRPVPKTDPPPPGVSAAFAIEPLELCPILSRRRRYPLHMQVLLWRYTCVVTRRLASRQLPQQSRRTYPHITPQEEQLSVHVAPGAPQGQQLSKRAHSQRLWIRLRQPHDEGPYWRLLPRRRPVSRSDGCSRRRQRGRRAHANRPKQTVWVGLVVDVVVVVRWRIDGRKRRRGRRGCRRGRRRQGRNTRHGLLLVLVSVARMLFL